MSLAPLYQEISKYINIKGNAELQAGIKHWYSKLKNKKLPPQVLALYYIKQYGVEYMTALLADEQYDVEDKELIEAFYQWLGELDILPYLQKGKDLNQAYSILVNDYLETMRVQKRDGFVERGKPLVKQKELYKTVYDDINKADTSPYESKKMGHVNIDNVSVGKCYIYLDTFFSSNTGTSFSTMIGTKEQYIFNVKSVAASQLMNIKQFKVSEVLMPQPINWTLGPDDILKMNIEEVSLLAHREYPNLNYLFEFKVQALGSRFLLTPLNDTYKLFNYIANISSITFKMYYQNLLLAFNEVSYVGVVTYGNPTTITFPSHGLLTGDRVSIYNYEGVPQSLSYLLNSSFIVTVLGPNAFTIPVDTSALTSPSQVRYWVSKYKFEFNLELTYL